MLPFKSKLIFGALIFTFLLIFIPTIKAASNNSFVNIVNPVRGDDFWDLKDQKPTDSVVGQLEILRQSNLAATFLIRYDGLQKPEIVSLLKNSPDEKGLFLEVTSTLTSASAVEYHQSSSWHNAASVLITGYEVSDRKKLIDSAFTLFKQKFGDYPKSVGAWWIDAGSLGYMQQKYGITNAMTVADQYSTDSYQIWGQYWGTPYYPAKNNALFPAQSVEEKIPLVITQWAARDPVNGYGTSVGQSTYSVQANDYLDYHSLDTSYFSKLVDIYTLPEKAGNQFGQLVVGLENSYSWQKYKTEYQNQINDLVKKQKAGQFRIVTLDTFASWYQNRFPQTSPEQLIKAKDPLGSTKQAAWYMNNFYRAGWIYNNEGSVIRDLRQYVLGQSEICLEKQCREINFATFATRVLDEVTYGQKRVIDEGQISNIQIGKQGQTGFITYNNAAGNKTAIDFLLRDISLDQKPSTIDAFILDAIQNTQAGQKQQIFNGDTGLKSSLLIQFGEALIFLIFIFIAVLIPGEVIIKKILPEIKTPTKLFLCLVTGLVELVLISFLSQILLKNFWLIPIWVVVNLGLFIYFKLFLSPLKTKISRSNLILAGIIILGTIFLIIPTFRNGLEYGYGIGFWGPNGHDGVWHLSLINQLVTSAPPLNPILAGTKLQNYHYFFDLLVAVTAVWSKIPIADLLFREFPILFGLLLGLGTLSLLNFLNEEKNLLVQTLSLYLVYTAGSFGWIVELIKKQGANGESDFWANQAISFNLNPPFMISLLILAAFTVLLFIYHKNPKKLLLLPLIFLSGALFEFKAYAAILLGLTLLILTVIYLSKRNFNLLPVLLGMGILSVGLLIPNYPSLAAIFQTGSGVFQFSPFWLVDSLVDSPDRLGWTRLSLARIAGLENHNFVKIAAAEFAGVILFILGNLGIRSFALIIFGQKKLWKVFSYQFIFVLSIISILIPLLIIQKGTPWNTIQFFYYFLFFSAILTAILLSKVLNKLPTAIRWLLIILVIIVAPVNCVAVAAGYLYPKPHAYISSGELTALLFLKAQPEGVVLTYPYNKDLKKSLKEPLPLLAYETTSYVSAISAKTSFEEDEIQQDILNFAPSPEYIKRLAAEKDFFSGMEASQAMAFLQTNKIKYIYLPKIDGVSLDEQLLGLKNIFENEDTVIYQVIGNR